MAKLLAVWLMMGCVGQVPPPRSSVSEAGSLWAEQRKILDDEAARLAALSGKLASSGKPSAASEVLQLLGTTSGARGATRFLPRQDVIPARAAGLANVPTEAARGREDASAIRRTSVTALFDLAKRAGTSEPTKHYALADSCLRAVLERDPDHADARRLLGYVPYEGGWATPYAVRQLREGKVKHPVYGWVKKTWVPHLEQGELPAPGTTREAWLPAEEADRLRRSWNHRWRIFTEHFRIETNVPLSEAIVFGQHLESFNDLFQALMADVLGEKLPLAQRFKAGKAADDSGLEPHVVYYFAERDEFVSYLRPRIGEDASQILGIYLPPERRQRRVPAFSFRDRGGELDVLSTLYHEVSHQLLFESGTAGMFDYKKTVGNFWVFEGLGTYFETLVTRRDGSLEIGGLVGNRIEAARESLVEQRRMVPLAQYVGFDEERLRSGEDRYVNYQQAAAFATFLMQAGGGRYREAFLEYVKDAYHGRLGHGRPALDARLDRSYRDLEAEFLTYLSKAQPER